MTYPSLLVILGGATLLAAQCVDGKNKTQDARKDESLLYQEQTENVLGNEKPETYVELNGVKYYSRIDGKDISDLVKK